jgi:predicted RNA-binding protein (virulence factor B family)
MAELGRRNQLTVLRSAKPGIFLDGGETGEILMPRRYVTDAMEPGAVVDVFLYKDSEDRLVATTETPLAMVGEFALLRVVSARASIGAFLDWGLTKDLLLPRNEQSGPVREGSLVAVRVYVDERSERIVASMKLQRWLGKTRGNFRPEQEVGLFITDETPLGYNAIVDGTHRGLLYHGELARPLQPGETVRGYVRAVRPDGKLDVSLDRAGYVRVKPLSEQILQKLAEAGGFLPFHDKSSSDEIRDAFGVSKKAFKQALGALYRKRRIAMEPEGIRLAGKRK